MKKLILVALAVISLAGCATSHKDGTCKTYVDGACMMVYKNNVGVPSGDIDMRFTGLVREGAEIHGTVSSKARNW